jgi:hypothetical protein
MVTASTPGFAKTRGSFKYPVHQVYDLSLRLLAAKPLVVWAGQIRGRPYLAEIAKL